MRLIDADALDYGMASTEQYSFEYVPKYQIDNAPTIDAVPVRHGMWSKAKDDQGYTIEEEEYDFFYVCSACGRWTIGARNYCPNCGAKMDEGEDNED